MSCVLLLFDPLLRVFHPSIRSQTWVRTSRRGRYEDRAPCLPDRQGDDPDARTTTPPRRKHTLGRPPVVGPRLPSLERVLQDPHTVWQRLTLDWEGEGKRTLEVCTGTAWWYRFGSTPLPMRWVLTRDPAGKRPAKA
jgi:hypothetical protein